jgi:hypothetical protein
VPDAGRLEFDGGGGAPQTSLENKPAAMASRLAPTSEVSPGIIPNEVGSRELPG